MTTEIVNSSNKDYIIYTDFLRWKKLVEDIGGSFAIDPRWHDTMLAFDANDKRIGSFVWSKALSAGIVFKSGAHFLAFIMEQ